MELKQKVQTFKTAFSDFQEGGFNNGENGGRDNGNTGQCKGGHWVNKGSYWAQPTCNNGANWFINKQLMGAAYDYEFSADQKNRDNDDSGFVFRFKDKNNFIRFHHTIQHVYNNQGNKKHWISGGTNNGNCISGTGSYLVVRKGGKEYCAKRTTWKYTQNKYHNFRIISKISGQVQVYIDKTPHECKAAKHIQPQRGHFRHLRRVVADRVQERSVQVWCRPTAVVNIHRLTNTCGC